jgi:hypothetical protein
LSFRSLQFASERQILVALNRLWTLDIGLFRGHWTFTSLL